MRTIRRCRQWPGAASDVSDFVFGTLGHANVQRHQIKGDNAWRWRSDEPDDMYQNEHDVLFASIRDRSRKYPSISRQILTMVSSFSTMSRRVCCTSWQQ